MDSPSTHSPLTPLERSELMAKAARGELTPADTKRVIEATRASFLSRAAKAPSRATTRTTPKALPETFDVDFF